MGRYFSDPGKITAVEGTYRVDPYGFNVPRSTSSVQSQAVRNAYTVGEPACCPFPIYKVTVSWFAGDLIDAAVSNKATVIFEDQKPAAGTKLQNAEKVSDSVSPQGSTYFTVPRSGSDGMCSSHSYTPGTTSYPSQLVS